MRDVRGDVQMHEDLKIVIKNTFIDVDNCNKNQGAFRRCRSAPALGIASRDHVQVLLRGDSLQQTITQAQHNWLQEKKTQGMSSGDARDSRSTSYATDPDSQDNVKTYMLKNLPCRCNKDDILELVKDYGFMEHLVSIYLPVRNTQNLGYAFVGFITPEIGDEFCKKANGCTFRTRSSKKTIAVVPARVQQRRRTDGGQETGVGMPTVQDDTFEEPCHKLHRNSPDPCRHGIALEQTTS